MTQPFGTKRRLQETKHWSQITPSLYSICFTGKAQTSNHCELCMSVSHGTKQCPLQVDADPDLPIRLNAVELAVVSLASCSQGVVSSGTHPKSTEICRLWNESRCRFFYCKCRHPCSQCRELHPAISCLIASQAKGDSTVETTGGPTKRQPRRDGVRPYACRTSGSQGTMTLCWGFDS